MNISPFTEATLDDLGLELEGHQRVYTPPKSYTLDNLAGDLGKFEAMAKPYLDLIARKERSGSPTDQITIKHDRAQIAALVTHARKCCESIPGLLELRALCQVLWKEELTAAVLPRITGCLCMDRAVSAKEVNQMQVSQIVTELQQLALPLPAAQPALASLSVRRQ